MSSCTNCLGRGEILEPAGFQVCPACGGGIRTRLRRAMHDHPGWARPWTSVPPHYVPLGEDWALWTWSSGAYLVLRSPNGVFWRTSLAWENTDWRTYREAEWGEGGAEWGEVDVPFDVHWREAETALERLLELIIGEE